MSADEDLTPTSRHPQAPEELPERLEVSLIDLSEGEALSEDAYQELVRFFGDERALEAHLAQLERERALAHKLSAHLREATPSEAFVSEVLNPQRRPQRALRAQRERFEASTRGAGGLWISALLLLCLLTLWGALNAHQERRERAFQPQQAQPVPEPTKPESPELEPTKPESPEP